MPKPICPSCHRFFRPARTGIFVLEQMPRRSPAPPGAVAPLLWQPYKIWQADLFVCEGCRRELVTGFGKLPVTEHFRPDFAYFLPLVSVTVNDC